MSSEPVMQGSFVVLWAGEDPALHSTLLEQLESAGIPFSDKVLGDDEVAPTADPLPIDWKPRFGFEVVVSLGDFQRAKQILDKLLEEEPVDVEIPARDQPPAEEAPLAAPAEKRLSMEVWSGSDDRIARFLKAAMQENRIPIQLGDSGEETKIYVSAANEKRAREIVREIVEGVPPE